MKLSVVSPIFNEQDTIPELCDRIVATMKRLDIDYEVILVDDGSTDRTAEVIRSRNEKNPRLTGLHLSRNFGHQAALTAGLNHVSGDAIVLMDGDLQDPPECIPEFLDYWNKGYHVVFATRVKRKEIFLKRIGYVAFYRILQYLSNIHIPLNSGDFALIDRQVVDELNALPERNRFLRGLRAWVGFRQIGIPVERHARHSGRPGYTLRKLVRLASDGIFSFSWMPLRLLSCFGLVSVMVGLIYFIVLFYLWSLRSYDIPGWTTLIFTVVGFGGAHLLGLGIIGEYVGRIYDEVKQRPSYVIAFKTGTIVENE